MQIKKQKNKATIVNNSLCGLYGVKRVVLSPFWETSANHMQNITIDRILFLFSWLQISRLADGIQNVKASIPLLCQD